MSSPHPIHPTLKRLRHRNGLFLKDIWAHHLVDNDDAILIQDILESLKDSLIFSKTEKEREVEEASIPTAFMNEMTTLVYKSLVTGRSFIRDLNSGQHTHAEISAYNGCLYWARSILLIFGIWLSPKKLDNNFWIIDIYPLKERKITSKFNFLQIGNKQPGHIEIWLTLKRILNTSKNFPIDDKFIGFMNDIDETSIGFKRHHLQYFNHYWINLDDLKNDCISTNDLSWIQEFNEDIYAKLDLRDTSPENSIIYFYFILARNFYFLINEIKPSLPDVFVQKIEELKSSFNFIEIFNKKNWLDIKDSAF